jgi:hypothetical protein
VAFEAWFKEAYEVRLMCLWYEFKDWIRLFFADSNPRVVQYFQVPNLMGISKKESYAANPEDFWVRTTEVLVLLGSE